MEIYVVQQGDNIYSIAEIFGVTVERLAIDNGLEYPYDLIVGQSIVIAYPKKTHTVQEGDTLQSIADMYNIPLMQLIRNNIFLLEMPLYPGENLTISYHIIGDITSIGFAYPYIKYETLFKSLPSLTYLSIFNYRVSDQGDIIEYHDDSEIIKTSIDYGTIPIMMMSSASPMGEPNVEMEYNLLLNEEAQENNINQVINIMRSKGYYGFNITFNYLNENSQELYLNFTKKISERLHKVGFLFFITVNYINQETANGMQVSQIDYTSFSTYVDGMIFLKFLWRTINTPPLPECNMSNLATLIDYVVTKVPSDKIIIGKPLLGYDWELPFQTDRSKTVSLSLEAVYNLAQETGAFIQYDEKSQNPYYLYNQINIGIPVQHIVWFIDARSLNVIDELIKNYSLIGCGAWNIMVYYAPLWTLINSQFNIIKLI